MALRSHHPGSPEHDGAAWFGVSAAVLAGDLAFVWADRLLDALDHAELPGASIRRARELFSQMRTEVIAGQYLDLRVGGSDTATEHDGSQIALLKSARYTVTRPLQIGAVLAQADDEMCARLAAYGDAVGTAFQLRDDVLGLFGDPVQTGKSCVDDLREGKRNVLVLRALRLATEAERAVLHATLGAPHVDDVVADRCREVVSGSGALASVEATISELLEQALAVATTFDPAATPALEHLAWYAARRDR
ncbi:MAG: polyprenyl synthetase family protein [Actinobacteria bacterium]|nr:polyprenyl synthetase family protein [Actinomycetota bacterium]